MSAEKKKPDNIVKKVFERSGARPDKVSPLFTHFKNQPKVKAQKPAKAAKEPKTGSSKRLPAAVDFGQSRIKLLQLVQDAKGGYEVATMDEELLSEEPGRAEIVKNKQALEKLLSRNPVSPQVIVGLPAKETQTFNFTFPVMADEELREAVKWKIKQLRPFDLDEEKVKYVLLRWEAAPAPGAQGAQQRVTVVCVSGNNLSEKAALLNEVGLKPISMQVSALSLVQTKRTSNVSKNPDEVVLWLDLGAEESVFIVEKGGVVYFLRNLSVTGKQMTKQVAQSCKLDERKAEEMKAAHGLDFWSPQFQSGALTDEEKAKNASASVCLALVSVLENLVLDVEHSFKFFSYQVSQSQISKFDRIILTGGASNVKKMDQFLSDRLSVPVDRLDPFFSLRVQDTLKTRRPNLAEDGARFASAAGLALSHVQAADAFNLLAGEKKKRVSVTGRIKMHPKVAVSLAALLCVAAIVPPVASVFYFKNEAATLSKRVKEARADLKRRQSSQLELAEQEKKMLERKAMLEEKLTLFRQSGRDQRRFSETLVKLASLMPEEIWVTKLSYADKRMILVASTAKNESMIQFLDNLKKPDDFSDVVFNYTKRDPKSPVFSFEVMMSVK
jgi:type IV pilus assembly protein PilM